jgi:hypothetical protein
MTNSICIIKSTNVDDASAVCAPLLLLRLPNRPASSPLRNKPVANPHAIHDAATVHLGCGRFSQRLL